jgi:cellulose synthase/poly-beta-1,6-N-acetylglucosamine synthase-like glycosyltransferase
MLSIVIIVYVFYYYLVLRKASITSFTDSLIAHQKRGSFVNNLANVSIIVSTFNEAKVIERKINNISQLNYPKDLLEVVVYDDNSTDGTSTIAEITLKETRLHGTVIHSPSRLGLNRSLNTAIDKAKNNIICITDSDVLLDKDALINAVNVLQECENAGGVTGHIQPVFEGRGVAQTSESSYRDFYHISMLAESSLHSAFPGNGPLIVYDKSKVPSKIPNDYGSTDANIAMNIIRHGLRFLYVPNSIVYEPSPENLGDHQLQKIRRAKRLLQVFLRNYDVALTSKYGSFGHTIFPLKLLMHALCPLLLLTGLVLIGLYIALAQNIFLYALAGAILTGTLVLSIAFKRFGSLLSSFILHQCYLVIGLLSSHRKSVYWKTIDRKTKIKF